MRRKFSSVICACAIIITMCGGISEGAKINAGWPVLQVVKAAKKFGGLVSGKQSVLPEAVSDIAETAGGKRGKIILELIARLAAIVRYRLF